MSIDTRLRRGLPAEVDLMTEVETVDSWAAVLDRAAAARRRTNRVRLVSAALATAAAVALVVTLVVRPGGEHSQQPVGPPDGTPSPSPTETSGTDRTALVEGKWAAGPTPAQAVVDHLDEVGLGRWATAVLEGVRPDQDLTYQLVIQGGQLVMSKGADDAPPQVADVQAYRVSGDRIVLYQQGVGCRTALRWTVTGDRLRMTALHDECPDVDGTPELAYVHALYVALTFTRAS
jgi:hypothetical protein